MSAHTSGQRMRVAVRTRPTAAFAQDQIFVDTDNAAISVHLKASDMAVDHRKDQHHFKFDAVLHNSTQDAVYDTLCQSVVADACNGRSGAIMAYGQTGSGKSYTMLGDPQSYRGRGVLPRVLAQVFSHIASRPEADYAVSVSYMELYGDKINDLLVLAGEAGAAPGTFNAGLMTGHAGAGATASSASLLSMPSPLAPGQYEVMDDAVHGTVVRGLTHVPVHAEADALRALFAAETVRTTAEHGLNARSNRAHCIFTVHIQQRNRLGGGRERIVASKLHCVDLAGSERLKKTLGVAPLGESPEMALLRESLNINKSLAMLESVVCALIAGRAHVPYRSSKLTNILKDALGGGPHPCSSVIIACLWGEARHIEECISTLRLAHRWAGLGSRFEGVERETGEEAVILDADALLTRLARENTLLRQELHMHDALADRSGAVVYGEMTPEQQARVSAQLRAFLAVEGEDAEIAALQLESVGHMHELLRQAKIMIKSAAIEAEERLRAQYNLMPKETAHSGTGSGGADAAASNAFAGNMGPGMGRVDEASAGLGLGLAPAHARPQGAVLLPPSSVARARGSGAAARTLDGSLTMSPGVGRATGPIALDLNGAWRQFKATPGLGAALAARISDAKAVLAEARAAVTARAREVNEKKTIIDAAAAEYEQVRAGHGSSAPTPAAAPPPAAAAGKGGKDAAPAPRAPSPVIDDEYRIAAELAAAKSAYRAARDEWTKARDALGTSSGEVSTLVAKMLSEFETWYASHTGRLPPLEAPVTSPARAGSNSSFGLSSPSFTRAASFAGQHSADALDEGEVFDHLELERATAVEPDSGAYFNATRKIRADLTTGSTLNARPLVRAGEAGSINSPSSPTKMGHSAGHFSVKGRR